MICESSLYSFKRAITAFRGRQLNFCIFSNQPVVRAIRCLKEVITSQLSHSNFLILCSQFSSLRPLVISDIAILLPPSAVIISAYQCPLGFYVHVLTFFIVDLISRQISKSVLSSNFLWMQSSNLTTSAARNLCTNYFAAGRRITFTKYERNPCHVY